MPHLFANMTKNSIYRFLLVWRGKNAQFAKNSLFKTKNTSRFFHAGHEYYCIYNKSKKERKVELQYFWWSLMYWLVGRRNFRNVTSESLTCFHFKRNKIFNYTILASLFVRHQTHAHITSTLILSKCFCLVFWLLSYLYCPFLFAFSQTIANSLIPDSYFFNYRHINDKKMRFWHRIQQLWDIN